MNKAMAAFVLRSRVAIWPTGCAVGNQGIGMGKHAIRWWGATQQTRAPYAASAPESHLLEMQIHETAAPGYALQ